MCRRSLGIEHVFDSRSAVFAQQILEATKGIGVDIALNSLAGPLMDATFSVMAQGGRFVEIGKRGLWTSDRVRALGRDIAYSVVDWSDDAIHQPALIGGILKETMRAAEQQGHPRCGNRPLRHEAGRLHRPPSIRKYPVAPEQVIAARRQFP